MKTLFALILLVAAVLSFQVMMPESFTGIATADTTYVNPNGSSELAKLMRDMQQFSNRAKTDVRAGNTPESYPASFNKIYTAKISEGMVKSDYYKSFADLYVMSVKNYSGSSTSQRIETYNNMVNACLACHSQHCPGPVPVIKKMMIDTPKPTH